MPFEKHTHNSIKITINEAVLDDDPYAISTFHSKLQATLETAQQLHKSAIWITVHISRAQLIAEASKLGFEYHHADGSTATLCQWILGDQESRIPTYAYATQLLFKIQGLPIGICLGAPHAIASVGCWPGNGF